MLARLAIHIQNCKLLQANCIAVGRVRTVLYKIASQEEAHDVESSTVRLRGDGRPRNARMHLS